MKLLKMISSEIHYIKLLLNIAMRFKVLSVAITFSAFFVSMFSGISISFVIPFIQNIQNKSADSFFLFKKLGISFTNSTSELITILAIIMITTILVNVFTFACEYMSQILQEKCVIDLRSRMIEAMYHRNSQFFVENPTGELTNIFMLQSSQTGFSVFTTLQFLMNICVALIFIFLLILISPSWTLIIVIVFSILSVIIQFVTRKIHYYNSLGVKIYEKTSADFVNDILGIKILKVFKMQKIRTESYHQLFHDCMTVLLKSQKRVSFVPPFMESASVAFIMIFLIVLLRTNSSQFYSNMPFIIAFFTIMQRMKTVIIKINHCRAMMQRAKKYVYNIDEFLRNEKYLEKDGTREFEGFEKAIEFRNVCFEYEEGKPVLKNISFTVNKGETVAIVGGSGSGKTTISDLLLKFAEPTSGSITIDGVDLREFSRSSYYEKAGLVQQETFLFDNTIEWNIARGELSRFKRESIVSAAKFANIGEFISKLEKGYETPVGDRGGKLSGGEKQRVGIARAVVNNPALIVLDEPTSALDSQNEQAVIESIKKISCNRTVFVITHKLSSIEHANKIIVMQNGTVAGIGTHGELSKNNEVYNNLLRPDLEQEPHDKN